MIKDTNTRLQVVVSREENEQLKQIAKTKNTSVSKLCKEYILKAMKKDLKSLNESEVK